MSDIIKTQRSLARKALHQPEHQFDHLYRLICRSDWLKDALDAILSNQGSKTAGIDGLTKKALNSDSAKAEFAKELEMELRQKQFYPMPVRRVYIPKSNGKKRPLGIPTIKDRVVQMLVKMVLEPIYESDFLNCSNGFRPGRRTQDCIARLDSYINRRNKYYWVIEGDIKAAFDSIHHQILMKLLVKRIADQRFLKLIERFLKYRMSDLPLEKYRSRSPDNPYLSGDWMKTATQSEKSILNKVWKGNADNAQWRELKEKIKAKRGAFCEWCGSLSNLDLHHIIARKDKGKDVESNLQLLCRTCHSQTPSFGRR